METCKYHPLEPSSFYCTVCQQNTCSNCVDDTSSKGNLHCVRCGSQLEATVNSNNIAPFWRRIEEAFKYPVNSEALMMIIGVSVGMSIATSLPFGGLTIFIVLLALYGAMLNYSFMAMTNSAEGDFKPPNAVDALLGGLGMSFKMIFMIILMIVFLILTAIQFGKFATDLLAILFVVGLPAILISFANSGSILQALNPLVFVTLMFRVGFPYIVLLGFVLVMSSSVGIISSIIGDDFLVISTVLQSIVTNYYTVVMFHLMGYMLFQYQDRLGYSTNSDTNDHDNERSREDNALARINVLLKEGEYGRCLSLLKESAMNFPEDKRFSDKYFDLLLLLKQVKVLQSFAETYFLKLANSLQTDRLYSQYRRISLLEPTYRPRSSELRYQLALSSDRHGDFKTVVLMVKGLHIDDIKYVNIISAYQLLASALTSLGQSVAAQKCSLLVEKLKTIAPASRPEPEIATQVINQAAFSGQRTALDSSLAPGSSTGAAADEMGSESKSDDLPAIEFKL